MMRTPLASYALLLCVGIQIGRQCCHAFVHAPLSITRRPALVGHRSHQPVSLVVLKYKDVEGEEDEEEAEDDGLDLGASIEGEDEEEEDEEEASPTTDPKDKDDDDVKIVSAAASSKPTIDITDEPSGSIDDDSSTKDDQESSSPLLDPEHAVRYKSMDFKMFLTQCSLQSFMFLLRSMRDPQTLYWLERFAQPPLVSVIGDDTTDENNSKTKTKVNKSNWTFSLPSNNMDEYFPGSLKQARQLALKNKKNSTDVTTPSSASTNATTTNATATVTTIKRKSTGSVANSYLTEIGSASSRSVVKKSGKNHRKPRVAAKHGFGNSYLDSMSSPNTQETPKDWSSSVPTNATKSTIPTNATKSTTVDPKPEFNVTVSAALAEAAKKRAITSKADDDLASSDAAGDETSEALAAALSEDKSKQKQAKKHSSKLLQYHGLGAMNTTLFPTWEEFFAQLLEQPSETLTVESHLGPDYDLEIDPASLCSRIVSVREQISKEFVKDLEVIADMGGNTLESYWDSLKARREKNSTDDSPSVDNEDAPLKFERENLLFLEMNTESTGRDPSPLRKGNFDLLVLLCTQEAIHRVLNDEDRQKGPEKVTNNYLAQFYNTRLQSFFTGVQRYGRADDFLEELLSAPPRVVTVEEGTTLIDPTRIAELILEHREAVALDWKQQAEDSPLEHMVIQKMRLNRMMKAGAAVETVDTKDEDETVDIEEGGIFQ